MRVAPPQDTAVTFFNRKNFYSINVQVVCSADGIVQNVVARWPGSTHDARIFRNSNLRERLESGDLKDFILIGDGGYPLMPYLLTPISNPNTRAQETFNHHFIRTRLIIERTFGVVKKVFGCVGGSNTLATKLSTSTATIIAVFVLHNIRMRGNMQEDEVTDLLDTQAFNTGLGEMTSDMSGRVLRNTLIARYFDN